MATLRFTLLSFLFILLTLILLEAQAIDNHHHHYHHHHHHHAQWQPHIKHHEDKARAMDKHHLAPWQHAKHYQDMVHAKQGHHARPLFPPKHHKPNFKPGPWQMAHATFYGGLHGEGTTDGGACGYGELASHGYGYWTAALNEEMFNNGLTCGACYEIKCVDDPQWCKPGQPSLFVTATNMGPPPGTFDLTEPAFISIAAYQAGIIPIQQRRVPCYKQGGIRFTITGNPYYTTILVWNVGGAGDVRSLKVKGDKNVPWTGMQHDWGQNWKTCTVLVGESLTFRVEASDRRKSTSWHLTPRNWQYGQTYEGKNFR